MWQRRDYSFDIPTCRARLVPPRDNRVEPGAVGVLYRKPFMLEMRFWIWKALVLVDTPPMNIQVTKHGVQRYDDAV